MVRQISTSYRIHKELTAKRGAYWNLYKSQDKCSIELHLQRIELREEKKLRISTKSFAVSERIRQCATTELVGTPEYRFRRRV